MSKTKPNKTGGKKGKEMTVLPPSDPPAPRARGKLRGKRPKLAEWQGHFLTHFAGYGIIGDACKAARVSRDIVDKYRQKDSLFAAAFADAQADAVEVLEAAARHRAVEGVRRLKFDKMGNACIDPETGEPYDEREYSDALLTTLLRAHSPKYREKAELRVEGAITQVQLTVADLEALQARRREAILRGRGEVIDVETVPK
jgi:hypothetical protein